MKQMILEWKRVFPIKYLEIGEFMTDDMLFKMVNHYSNVVTTLTISFNSILTIKGYKHLTLLKPSNLIELSIQQCLGKGLAIISRSFTDLKTLRIAHVFKATNKAVDSFSRLTNLVKIELYDCIQNDISVVNYSSLINIASMTLIWCENLTGVGLRYLVVSKEFLVQLKITECHKIAAEGYHCLTTLTNLTNLTVNFCQFNDIGLNMICSTCLLIEYLDVQGTGITIEGLINIHCLIHLKSLILWKP
jgi:Leucine-rich repeat (LRR) protein